MAKKSDFLKEPIEHFCIGPTKGTTFGGKVSERAVIFCLAACSADSFGGGKKVVQKRRMPSVKPRAISNRCSGFINA